MDTVTNSDVHPYLYIVNACLSSVVWLDVTLMQMGVCKSLPDTKGDKVPMPLTLS